MQVDQLEVPGAVVVTPRVHSDDRGWFAEYYRHEALSETVGHPLHLAQANCSTSRRGVIRGLHFADVPPGQAKYVTCVSGAVLDVVVDLRVGSPSFGRSAAARLDGENHRALYLAEGLGHAFCALTQRATVVYLCSTVYTPSAEHAVHPLDADLALPWPDDLDIVLSAKDAEAPSLAEALAAGTLPTMADCAARYRQLRRQREEGAR